MSVWGPLFIRTLLGQDFIELFFFLFLNFILQEEFLRLPEAHPFLLRSHCFSNVEMGTLGRLIRDWWCSIGLFFSRGMQEAWKTIKKKKKREILDKKMKTWGADLGLSVRENWCFTSLSTQMTTSYVFAQSYGHDFIPSMNRQQIREQGMNLGLTPDTWHKLYSSSKK